MSDDVSPHEKVLGPRYLPRVGRRRFGACLRWRVEFLIGVLAWRDPTDLSMTFVSIGLGPVEVQVSMERVFSRRDERNDPHRDLSMRAGAELVTEVEDFLAGRSDG